MKNTKSIFEFPNIFLPFNAFKLTNAKLCWWDKESKLHNDYMGDEAKFINDFSYLTISLNESLNHRLNNQDMVTMRAEIYGGDGCGGNAGGVRCGILNGFQMKGIGRNPLVGRNVHQNHSNGTLNLIDGALELIYAKILDRFLPNGAVNIPAIIYTGNNTAFSRYGKDEEYSSDHGCIILREPALRPAHFMPCENYTGSLTELSSQFKSKRIEVLYDNLKNICGDNKGFVKFICEFILISASQFSHAKIFGLMHGTLSFSNQSLDGRWLDLTCTTFIDGYTNCNVSANPGVLPFLRQHEVAIETTRRLFWEYSKHHELALDINPLHELFLSAYSEGTWRSFLEFWSIYDENLINDIGQADREMTLTLFFKFCMLDSKIDFRSPSDIPEVNFPLQLSITVLASIAREKLDDRPILGASAKEANFFLSIMFELFKNYASRKNTSLLRVVTASAIVIIRRTTIMAFFYRGNIIELLKEIVNVENFDVKDVAKFIDKSIKLFEWAVTGRFDSSTQILIAKVGSSEVWWNSDEMFDSNTVKTIYESLLNTHIKNNREISVFNYYIDSLKLYAELSKE
jgi:hypothetical protein